MPHPFRPLCWLFAASLALSACRPGDAPKEPVEPNDDPTDPQVSSDPSPRTGGGVSVSVGRRGQAVARL